MEETTEFEIKKGIDALTLIALVGPPGSGKSRLGVELEKVMNAGRIVTGDALRSIAREESELGKFVHSILSKRMLVPGALLKTVMQKALGEFIGRKETVILDGYPRNIEQLKVCDTFLHGLFWVVIDISFDVCKERIDRAKDRMDREDDKKESVKEHGFVVYENETLPMMKIVEERERARVFHVDGLKSPEEIAKEIKTWIKNK